MPDRDHSAPDEHPPAEYLEAIAFLRRFGPWPGDYCQCGGDLDTVSTACQTHWRIRYLTCDRCGETYQQLLPLPLAPPRGGSLREFEEP